MRVLPHLRCADRHSDNNEQEFEMNIDMQDIKVLTAAVQSEAQSDALYDKASKLRDQAQKFYDQGKQEAKADRMVVQAEKLEKQSSKIEDAARKAVKKTILAILANSL